MIGFLEGILVNVEPKEATVKASGVGYRVILSQETSAALYPKLQKEVSLWIHTAVRENALELFGFLQKKERDFFELLITISGIGPRSALSILSLSSIETLRGAIASNNVGYLTKISGIGKKTAEKIVLELQGKIGEVTPGEDFGEESDVLEALKSLGYQEKAIRETLKMLPKEVVGTTSRIREALKILS